MVPPAALGLRRAPSRRTPSARQVESRSAHALGRPERPSVPADPSQRPADVGRSHDPGQPPPSTPHRAGPPLEEPFYGYHSARRGTYRIVYRINEDKHTVEIHSIRHRRDAYRT